MYNTRLYPSDLLSEEGNVQLSCPRHLWMKGSKVKTAITFGVVLFVLVLQMMPGGNCYCSFLLHLTSCHVYQKQVQMHKVAS